MCHLIPLNNRINNRAVLLQLDGGGDVPLSFGVETKNDKSIYISLSVKSDMEYNLLDTIKHQMIKMVTATWTKWFPDNNIPTTANPLISERKKRGISGDLWPGVMKANIDPGDCAKGVCTLMDAITNTHITLDELPGRRWTKAIVELRYIYIQSKKSYGITKRLRYLMTEDRDNVECIVPL